MALDLSPETEAQIIAEAEASGLTVDQFLRELLARTEDDPELIAAVEEAFCDVEAGRVRPAREAMMELGAKPGFSRRNYQQRRGCEQYST